MIYLYFKKSSVNVNSFYKTEFRKNSFDKRVKILINNGFLVKKNKHFMCLYILLFLCNLKINHPILFKKQCQLRALLKISCVLIFWIKYCKRSKKKIDRKTKNLNNSIKN